MASKAYGSRTSYFVTNGTSTANKIVLQALVQPGDLVLVDRDCHKSHHYGLVLSGALPVYLDSYPIEAYSMYGAVPLEHIKEKLLTLKEAGRLNKVKMLLLTNCTFDGLVYNVRRVMEEVLAIKPDMIFLWDEAWFAFATFSYTYKQRTAMYTASRLKDRYRSEAYRAEYEQHLASLKEGEIPRLPDPDKVRVRVYSTHSTHKTLSSFRQGSMIHVWDEDFGKLVSDSFHEAYMTHTSTSPNYQILASLDVGRRQVQFEGYEMVEKSLEMAMVLRAKISDHPLLSKYFKVLTIKDLISDAYRQSDLEEYYSGNGVWNRLEEAWAFDEFVLDPTKITLAIGHAGIDGDTFKNKYLMDQFNIQINKTSRNSVLFMTNIGTTRGSVAYLINSLLQIAGQVEEDLRSLNPRELEIREAKVTSLMEDVPPLPDFSRFHSSFQAVPGVPGGDIRQAYFLAYDETRTHYIPLHECLQVLRDGGELVSCNFVIPYPPGFPVLVPGQEVSEAIIQFLLALDVKEIHGYRSDLGLKVFRQSALDRQKTASAMGMKRN
jgi:arginine decarboxylase